MTKFCYIHLSIYKYLSLFFEWNRGKLLLGIGLSEDSLKELDRFVNTARFHMTSRDIKGKPMELIEKDGSKKSSLSFYTKMPLLLYHIYLTETKLLPKVMQYVSTCVIRATKNNCWEEILKK